MDLSRSPSTPSNLAKAPSPFLSRRQSFQRLTLDSTFLSVTKQGVAAIVETTGNPHCHVILRGGSKGTNYDSQSVAETAEALKKAGLEANIMIDCSHGNSSKQHLRQIVVADDIAEQLSSAAHADSIVGVMIESNLVEGKQAIPTKAADLPSLTYGQSVTEYVVVVVRMMETDAESRQCLYLMGADGEGPRRPAQRCPGSPTAKGQVREVVYGLCIHCFFD